MNTLWQALGSDGWRNVVLALLHTLWEGAAVALILFFVLRRVANPVARQRYCLLALIGILLAGFSTWAILGSSAAMPPPPVSPPAQSSLAGAGNADGPTGTTAILTPMEAGKSSVAAPATQRIGWVRWLALAWLAGTGLMLARVALSVTGAGRLRRAAHSLQDAATLALIEEAQRKLGMGRRVRAVVTDKLTSPAVAGVLVPTLILPLSLVTAMPASQLQFIILHELAHIRRGDYLANLFQQFVESLLFFNPAVWWVGGQLRHEREACCDGLAIAAAGGERLEYARVLASVAERALEGELAGAQAFAGPGDRPGLIDRVRRILTPEATPHIRMTWRALTGSLFFGGAVFVLSALGTQWTVAAAARLLTPQERIQRIETAMHDMGQEPERFAANTNFVDIMVRVHTADGARVNPSWWPSYADYEIVSGSANASRSMLGQVIPDSNGIARLHLNAGQLYLGVWLPGYAPKGLGPIDTLDTNATAGLDLLLDHGFTNYIRVLDADSGQPVPDISVSYGYWLFGPGSGPDISHAGQTDSNGVLVLSNSASLPLHMKLDRRGYEPGDTNWQKPMADEQLTIYARRALPIAGTVADATTGQAISGAAIYLIATHNGTGVNWLVDPWQAGRNPEMPPLSVADTGGHFVIDKMPRSGRFILMATAPHHADVTWENVVAGQTNLHAELGPEVVIEGRIEGDLSPLNDNRGGPFGSRGGGPHLATEYLPRDPDFNSVYGYNIPVHIENGVGYFKYTNLIAGEAVVRIPGAPPRFRRGSTRGSYATNALTSVTNWVIQLPRSPDQREVVFQFTNGSGVGPKGTVSLQARGMQAWEQGREVEITNGEVQFSARVGQDIELKRAHTVGYWFNGATVKVEPGADPQIVSIPTIPAGAIYADARNADGTAAEGVSFETRTIKQSPLLKGLDVGLSDTSSPADGVASYVATPLPLGGTYEIKARHGNNFGFSDPIKLSEAEPDHKVTVQFHPGVRVDGQVFAPSGQPATNATVDLGVIFGDEGSGVSSTNTDAAGRFEFDDCNPVSGKFLLTVRSLGAQGTRITANLKGPPLVIHLKAGLTISGQVVDKETGKPVERAEVKAFPTKPEVLDRLPEQETMTDNQGHFVIDTLRDKDYQIFAMFPGIGRARSDDIRAGKKKAITLELAP